MSDYWIGMKAAEVEERVALSRNCSKPESPVLAVSGYRQREAVKFRFGAQSSYSPEAIFRDMKGGFRPVADLTNQIKNPARGGAVESLLINQKEQ